MLINPFLYRKKSVLITEEDLADDVVSQLGAHDYMHTQSAPAAAWVINHNLGKRPSVTITDSAGTVIEGDVTHNNTNQCVVSFSSAFSGSAYCI